MKNIKLVSCGFSIALSVLAFTSLASAAPDPGQTSFPELSSSQKKDCRNDWNGKTLSTRSKKNEFAATSCAKSGYCALDGNKVSCGTESSSGGTLDSLGRKIEGCGDIDTSLIKCDTRAGNP